MGEAGALCGSLCSTSAPAQACCPASVWRLHQSQCLIVGLYCLGCAAGGAGNHWHPAGPDSLGSSAACKTACSPLLSSCRSRSAPSRGRSPTSSPLCQLGMTSRCMFWASCALHSVCSACCSGIQREICWHVLAAAHSCRYSSVLARQMLRSAVPSCAGTCCPLLAHHLESPPYRPAPAPCLSLSLSLIGNTTPPCDFPIHLPAA